MQTHQQDFSGSDGRLNLEPKDPAGFCIGPSVVRGDEGLPALHQQVEETTPVNRGGRVSSYTRQQQAIAAWTHGAKPRYRIDPEHDRNPRWYRRKAGRLLRQATRHMPPGAKRVAQVLAADMISGQYYKSQSHLGKRAHLSREWTNRYLQQLARRGIITIPKRQRLCVNPERSRRSTVAGPKTLNLAQRLLNRLLSCKSQGHTSKAFYPVMYLRNWQASIGRAELEHVLARCKRKRLSNGTWSACCPAHDDQNPSLAVTIGRRGQLLLHCFAGCAFNDVRAAFGLQAPRARWEEVAA
jgi:hypothetical protein